ncbi:hypothetical protein [Haloarcula marina]|uniref:hypothetical protein n=1 Tax=Haloarcula marina TaxID=2961574 RepID=UPI0020B7277D|nr:hypothetical protein [Halomicroarcula marina]
MSERTQTCRRRAFLTAVGAAVATGTTGCLRLTDGQAATTATDQQADAPAGTATTGPTEEPSAGQSDQSTAEQTQQPEETGTLPESYSTREDAISYVGSFARGQPGGYGSYDGDGPRKIAFSTSGSGTSGGSGANGSIVMSEDVIVESYAPGGFAFGGDTGRALRVRNLVSGTTLTFEPDAGTDRYDVTEADIETQGDGRLREESPRFEVAGSDGSPVTIPGSWSGDFRLFTRQTFATYVVELLEGGSVIGETGGRIFGKAYQYGFDQTESAAFITRQGSVGEEWQATFYLDNAYQPRGTATATHRPDDGVFEIDLASLDADPGEYDWALQLRPSNSMSKNNRYIQLRSVFGNPVYIE